MPSPGSRLPGTAGLADLSFEPMVPLVPPDVPVTAPPTAEQVSQLRTVIDPGG